jgi:putative transposase
MDFRPASPKAAGILDHPAVMPRRNLAGSSGYAFHIVNRAARRLRLFESDADYGAFIRSLRATRDEVPVHVFAYCVMPNHFHLVVRPGSDENLARFMQLLTGGHARHWNVARGVPGVGAVYQGRYRAFPIQHDRHFVTVCRYVEQNALRAGMVRRAEDWPWTSLVEDCRNCNGQWLDPWPIPKPQNWLEFVNELPSPDVLAALRRSLRHGVPFGDVAWRQATASQLNLPPSPPQMGRPRRTAKSPSGGLLRKS